MAGYGYGLIYESIWDSSVARDWEAVIVFMALVSIADAEDNVYMDPERLSRKTNIPFRIVLKGLKILLEPDSFSHSRVAEGRRITFLPLAVDGVEPSLDGQCRGWHVVNRKFYKDLLRKRYNSNYQRRKRLEAKRSAIGPQTDPAAAAAALENFRREAPCPAGSAADPESST